MKRKKTVLVAPLDWGLGHASRCIPVIREIIQLGHEPVIASDGRALELLKVEFPELKWSRLQGYNPVYPEDDGMVKKMAAQVPKFFFAIVREHLQLRRILRQYSIDAVISDNRYGLWTREKPSALLTHQLFIQMPAHLKWAESWVNRLNHFFIRKFHSCWTPDFAGEDNLSGALSHGNTLPANVTFIGTLSRFSLQPAEKGPEFLVILSGPEPQRSLLEEKITAQLQTLPVRSLIVRGVTEESKTSRLNEWCETVSHLTSEKMNAALLQSETVVCRSGYSSIMELVSLGKQAILIPTPGQTEQEYLAERLSGKNLFVMQTQDALNLQEGMRKLKELNNSDFFPKGNMLKETLKQFLDSAS